MKNTYKNKGFTLPELIVVIAILVILGTFGIIILTSNLANARDAARFNDIQEITNVLHLYETENNEYPKPSDNTEVYYSGALAWNQGLFGDSMGIEVEKFGVNIPTDPKYKNYYSYSTTAKQNEFQIASIKETNKEVDDDIGELQTFLLPQVSADSVETSLVKGDYNGFMILAKTGSINYFVASPSIISSDPSSGDMIEILSNQKLVYDDFFNLPASYSGFLKLDGGFNFNVTEPLIYSGSITDLKSEEQLLNFYSNLKYVYATSPTESFDKYISLLNQEGITYLKGFLTRRFKVAFKTYFNCKDILDDGLDDGDKEYLIDKDGPGPLPAQMVYCDMTTDGGGWTRINDNYIENGDFSSGNGVVGAYEYTNQDNVIVPLSQQVDGNSYALNQTGNYSSYYKIPFPDIEVLEPGYELRLTTWRSDYSTGSSSEELQTVNVLGGKYSRWTVGECTSSCYFQNFNRKLADTANINFGPGKILSDIEVNVIDRLDSGEPITAEYLQNGVLFDGFIPSTGDRDGYGQYPYSTSEKETISEWVEAGGFLISTNNEDDYDPLGEYFGMPTKQYSGQARWVVENIDHPLVNGVVGLKQDLRGDTLYGNYARAVLSGNLGSEDTVIARDYYPPYEPTIILRKHGKGLILFVADDGMFMNLSSSAAFENNDNESVLAAAILAYGIEKSAGINPKEGYAFHNRLYYSDGTFSINGAEDIIDTFTYDDGGVQRKWVKERIRHTIYKQPESFDWFLGLDSNNSKDLYFTGLRMEVFYR